MKRPIAIFILFMLTTWFASIHAADDSLVLYLTFDEGEGKTVADLSQYENDGKIQGELDWVDGVFESALYFPGLNSTVEVPHDNSLNVTDAMTIEMWVQLDASGGQDSEVGLEKGGWEAGEYSLYAHYVPGNGAAMQFHDLPADCGDANSGHLGPDLRDDTWHHLAGVWDGQKITIYVDGDPAITFDCGDGPIGTNGQSIFIGSRLGSMRFLKGSIDEVRVYRRALSQAEVKQDMQTLGGLSVDPTGKLALTWGRLKR